MLHAAINETFILRAAIVDTFSELTHSLALRASIKNAAASTNTSPNRQQVNLPNRKSTVEEVS